MIPDEYVISNYSNYFLFVILTSIIIAYADCVQPAPFTSTNVCYDVNAERIMNA